MANSITTNIGALTAQKNMLKINNDLDDAMTRLSSGLRINSAADDAAGSAIASKMESQVRSLGVAVRNSYDAISMTQTAEGALNETENMLQRIRELAVQAGNSTLSDSDRSMIQSEVTALISEIDTISKNTHFNDVKLLDGSNATVNFQIGINKQDSLEVSLQKSDSTALGLAGSKGVTKLSSERVATTDFSNGVHTIGKADIKINGKDALSTNLVTDLTASSVNEAKGIADAINLNTGIHGAKADAFNSLSSAVTGTFNMTGTFTINGDTVELATSSKGLVANINETVSGINAKLNVDNTITLDNTSGASIIVAGAGATNVGFTAGTFTGFIGLENIDGSQVTIEAGNESNGYTNGLGTIADVNALGFNEQSVAGTLETAVVSGTALSANELKINNVLIGESSNGSANSLATAINLKSSDTGVTADAHNEIQIAFNTAAMPSAANEFFINGANVSLNTASGLSGIVTAINSANIGDVVASAISDGAIKLTSETGVDIRVTHTGDTDFIRAFKDVNGTVRSDGIVGGAATAAASLRAAAVSAPVMTLLTPADFNSRVAIASIGSDGASAHAVINTDSMRVSGAVSSTTGTLVAAATNTHAKGVVVRISADSTAITAGTTVTVVGTDMDGNDMSETITMPAASAITNGTKSFNTISSYTFNQTSASVVVMGLHHGIADTTFDIVGTDVFGDTVSETVRGVGGDLNALSKHVYASVTSVTSSKTSVSNMTIGNYNGEDVGDKFVGTDVDGFFASANPPAGALSMITGTDTKELGGALVTITTTNSGVANNGSPANVFTIVGTDMFGNAQTEVVAGPGASTTVKTLRAFNTVTSISSAVDPTSTAMQFGWEQVGDDFTANGNMKLSNSTGATIKLDTVAGNDDASMVHLTDGTFGTTETILQKVGLQAQSISEEVGATNLSVGTLSSAQSSLAIIDKAIAKVSEFRSSFGAVENRIDASISNLTTLKVNTMAAQSRIEDADFAAETSNLTKSQILSQAATSMLAQANASKQGLLALLQG